MQKEQKRNAEIRDLDRAADEEMETDIPQAARLKAHMKRRVERQTKTKWIRYATEYACEIVSAGSEEKAAMRRYLETTREAVMAANRKEKAEKKASFKRKRADIPEFGR